MQSIICVKVLYMYIGNYLTKFADFMMLVVLIIF
jgi:hypothetical protein